MILRRCLNEMVLQSSEHELSLSQRQPDGPGQILVNRRAAANLMSADGSINRDHLHHDPPLRAAPRFPDRQDRSTPRSWTVSSIRALWSGAVRQLKVPVGVEIITGRARRRRWGAEEKLRVVVEALEAGGSVNADRQALHSTGQIQKATPTSAMKAPLSTSP
jgi:hypothetical protein